MTPDITRMPRIGALNPTHAASCRAAIGIVSIDGDVAVTTRGLLAIARPTSGILLSSAVIAAVATRRVLPVRCRTD